MPKRLRHSLFPRPFAHSSIQRLVACRLMPSAPTCSALGARPQGLVRVCACVRACVRVKQTRTRPRPWWRVAKMENGKWKNGKMEKCKTKWMHPPSRFALGRLPGYGKAHREGHAVALCLSPSPSASPEDAPLARSPPTYSSSALGLLISACN